MNVLPDALRLLASLAAARFRAGLADLPVLVLIGLCLLTSAAFGLAAAYHLLRPLAGPAGASAVLAVLLLMAGLGLMVLLSVRRDSRTPVPPLAPPAASPLPEPASGAAAAPPQAADLGAQAAFVAGFLLARRW